MTTTLLFFGLIKSLDQQIIGEWSFGSIGNKCEEYKIIFTDKKEVFIEQKFDDQWITTLKNVYKIEGDIIEIGENKNDPDMFFQVLNITELKMNYCFYEYDTVEWDCHASNLFVRCN